MRDISEALWSGDKIGYSADELRIARHVLETYYHKCSEEEKSLFKQAFCVLMGAIARDQHEREMALCAEQKERIKILESHIAVYESVGKNEEKP